MVGSSSTWSMSSRRLVRATASRTRCASPRDRVGEGRFRLMYPKPTSASVSSRRSISQRNRAAEEGMSVARKCARATSTGHARSSVRFSAGPAHPGGLRVQPRLRAARAALARAIGAGGVQVHRPQLPEPRPATCADGRARKSLLLARPYARGDRCGPQRLSGLQHLPGARYRNLTLPGSEQ